MRTKIGKLGIVRDKKKETSYCGKKLEERRKKREER